MNTFKKMYRHDYFIDTYYVFIKIGKVMFFAQISHIFSCPEKLINFRSFWLALKITKQLLKYKYAVKNLLVL